ncbi:MAG: alpha/beta hydrolase [Dongiaceae bacterium]
MAMGAGWIGRRWLRRCLGVAPALALLIGCATPAERFADKAGAMGLERRIMEGSGFRHVLFWRNPGRPSPVLHVYIDGDGTPDIGGYPAADPTPRNPLMLRLLALDPGPAVLVGRPCYYGLAGDDACRPQLWTDERYSGAVVASMAAVAREILSQGPYRRVAWFGHSGGGALAMLLAGRVAESAAVVTVAANLDIDAWTDARGARRLAGSLNPARQPPLPAAVLQHHYAGGRDEIVPPEITRRGLAPGAGLTIVPDYDHRCCWEEIWTAVLADLAEDGL